MHFDAGRLDKGTIACENVHTGSHPTPSVRGVPERLLGESRRGFGDPQVALGVWQRNLKGGLVDFVETALNNVAFLKEPGGTPRDWPTAPHRRKR